MNNYLIVPDKTIAVIPTTPDPGLDPFDMNDVNKVLRPLNESRKRDWFRSDFYKCLPLSMGNMQGFSVSVPFSFSVLWNGGDKPEDLKFKFSEEEKQYNGKWHVNVSSHFGSGVITISLPFMLKSPNGVNLMTISPPNYQTPGLNTMTGVVEADNLRHTFSVNIKVNIPNVLINIEKDYPLAAILPIPRYFCDQFQLINSSDIFSDEQIEEEAKVSYEHRVIRDFLTENQDTYGPYDRSYFYGTDIRGNKFSDHQLPKTKRNDYE